MTDTFYITTPIYYANSLPHLGHLYTTIVADVVARHKRQRGFDTYFLTGTDEHGINIQRAAEKAGRTNKEQVDYISGELKRMFHDFGLDGENGGYDVFMRTTEPFHYTAVQHLWREIAKNKTPKGNDAIYKGFYEGWFCAPCAEFKNEGEYLLNKSDVFATLANQLVELVRKAYRENDISLQTKDLLSEKLIKLARGGINFSVGVVEAQTWFGDDEKLSDESRLYLNELFKDSLAAPVFDVLVGLVSGLHELSEEKKNDLVRVLNNLKETVRKNDLLTPRCLIHNVELDLVAEESYFFRLSDYGEFLIDKIENSTGLVRPDARKNEVLSFIRGGLQDLSISRLKTSVSWGVPVPDDEDHVMYVWLDALSNYITAIGYGAIDQWPRDGGWQNPRSDHRPLATDHFERYWPAVHLVGKDILRFHTVYWFSFLHAAGLPLPKTVYAHGMWLDADGRKMGKTLGNVIEVDVLHEHFQVDAVRYFALREMVFGQDGKFGYEALIDRANSDLASGLGNLASRTFSMITKYRDGKVPSGKIAEENYLNARRAGLDPDGQDIVSVVTHARDEFLRRFENFEFSQALEIVWTVIARIDKMISDAKPWELVKDGRQAETLNAVLYRASETLRWLCVLLYPVMPAATKNIYAQIGLSDDISKLDPAGLNWGELQPGTAIGETVAVFPRIDKNKVMSEINTDANGEKADNAEAVPPVPGVPPVPEQNNFITIDDFLKVDLRVGEVKVAERVEGADKLLRIEVDLGEEKPRQLLAGLAQWYEPEKLIGRKVVVVANLKPRKMRGLESQGMICAASLGEDDTPAIATFVEDVKIGARLK